MIIRVGHIPYLNMVPFHHGFGPEPTEINGHYFEFQTMSPRVLGLSAEKGSIDAGALSLVDWLKCSCHDRQQTHLSGCKFPSCQR